MKLSRIELTNFQGLRSARLQLTKPVLLATGHNGAGKSSLLEAIRLALLGNPERVGLKKELAKLVTEGAKRGGVDVITANQLHYAYTLPDGKHQAPADLGDYMPYLLDAQAFMRAKPDVRRSILFSLTGCKMSTDEVAKRLQQRGATAAKIDLVLPMLRSGFPAACDMAKEQATQAKGAWRAITGETYGEKKAESWEPEAVEPVDYQALDYYTKRMADHDEARTSLLNAQGSAKTQAEQLDNKRRQLNDAQQKAEQLPRFQKKLEVDQAELDKWEAKVAEAKAIAAPVSVTKPAAKLDNALLDAFAIVASEWTDLVGKTQGVVNKFNVCESWDQHAGLVNRTAAHLSTYRAQHGEPLSQHDIEDQQPHADQPNIAQLESSRDMFKRAVTNDTRDVLAAEAAVEQVKTLRAEIEAIGTIELDAINRDLAEVEKQRADDAATFETLKGRQKAINERANRIETATAHHRDVVEWSLIAEALAPSGIPAEILAGALRPANNEMHDAAAFVDWPRVQITSEMELTADGRPYALLSESEKWRADCLVSLMIAKLSGINLIVLDRFDVLDMKGRNDLIDLLDDAATQGTIETAIVAGTLKALPGELPETFDAVWIENGEINNLKLEGEQAA